MNIDLITSTPQMFFDLLERNREHLSFKWLQNATLPYLESMFESNQKRGRLIQMICVGDQKVGILDLNPTGYQVMLGYWIDHQWRNKGIMTAVYNKLFDENPSTIYVAQVDVDNGHSIALCNKIGMALQSEKTVGSTLWFQRVLVQETILCS